jgi:hypothetical protein
VTDLTAPNWLEAGADKVIVRSWLFPGGIFSEERLRRLSALVCGNLVVDISCRRVSAAEPRWMVALNQWKTVTETEVTEDSIGVLSSFCSEILVHPADENGKQVSVDQELIRKLSKWATVPVTYAGGVRSIEDLTLVDRASDGAVDLVIASALDIFGGDGVKLADLLKWNAEHGQDVTNVEEDGEALSGIPASSSDEPPAEQSALHGKLTRMRTEVERISTDARTTSRPVGDYCALCGSVFNFLWRRYECPNCGRFVCRDHSTHTATLRLKYTASGPLKVCDLVRLMSGCCELELKLTESFHQCYVELQEDGRQSQVDWTKV